MTKTDVYSEITDRIIAALEQGTVPWRKPWRTLGGGPVNVRTGRAYRGINIFLLELQGFSDPRWGTYRAIKEAGGQVRKGEHGTRIILWKPVKSKDEENGRAPYLLLKTYTVFNAEQCDDLPALEVEDRQDIAPSELAEKIAAGYLSNGGPGFIEGGSRAAYSPDKDIVFMPVAGDFDSADSYGMTKFHELAHSTGHKKRLDRIEPAIFGTDPYAREELVAEMAAAMLGGLAGIETAGGDQNAAYIAHWIARFKDDRKLLINSAAAAQKAADLICGDTLSDEELPAEAALAAA
jgi:antirestriction protein ArdC